MAPVAVAAVLARPRRRRLPRIAVEPLPRRRNSRIACSIAGPRTPGVAPSACRRPRCSPAARRRRHRRPLARVSNDRVEIWRRPASPRRRGTAAREPPQFRLRARRGDTPPATLVPCPAGLTRVLTAVDDEVVESVLEVARQGRPRRRPSESSCRCRRKRSRSGSSKRKREVTQWSWSPTTSPGLARS